jgi:hypothetical protein
VRPERFELPAFWFVARRSIQLSYGRISFRTAFQQLTAGSALSSTATFGHSKMRRKAPGLKTRAAGLAQLNDGRSSPLVQRRGLLRGHPPGSSSQFPYLRPRRSAVNFEKRFPDASVLGGVAASAVSFTFLIAPGGKGMRMSCPASR